VKVHYVSDENDFIALLFPVKIPAKFKVSGPGIWKM
jgi:hypothetical protein